MLSVFAISSASVWTPTKGAIKKTECLWVNLVAMKNFGLSYCCTKLANNAFHFEFKVGPAIFRPCPCFDDWAFLGDWTAKNPFCIIISRHCRLGKRLDNSIRTSFCQWGFIERYFHIVKSLRTTARYSLTTRVLFRKIPISLVSYVSVAFGLYCVIQASSSRVEWRSIHGIILDILSIKMVLATTT